MNGGRYKDGDQNENILPKPLFSKIESVAYETFAKALDSTHFFYDHTSITPQS